MDEHNAPKKQCTGPCGQEYSATPEHFYRSKSGKHGLTEKCKACIKWYRNLPEVKEHRKAYAKEYDKARNACPEIKANKQAYDKIYYARPEVKARQQAQGKLHRNQPEIKERKRNYDKARRADPGIHEKYLANRNLPQVKEQYRNHRKNYLRRPDIQAREQAWRIIYYSKTEVKERGRIHRHNRRSREKLVSGSHSSRQIQEQLKRQRYRCYYVACRHAEFKKVNGKHIYHIDHTYPLSRVIGTDIPANDMGYLVLACPGCNRNKSSKFPWEWPEGGRLL